MRDCTNPAVKDLLPELARDGDARDEALVAARAHVAGCESCERELALLREARGAIPTPRIDHGRIAAAIPPYAASGGIWRSPLVRIAAVILVVAGGTLLVTDAPPVPSPDTTAAVVATRETAMATPLPRRAPAAAPAPLEVGVGEQLSDLSETELRTLLEEMRRFEAVTSTETDMVVLPAPSREGV